jgi:hypothetical protein
MAMGEKYGCFALDIDGEEGMKSLTALETENALLPRTHTQRTGRGYQMFFKYPKGVRIPNKVGLRSGIDVRGDGGYCVGPGSLHANGETYRWVEHVSPQGREKNEKGEVND